MIAQDAVRRQVARAACCLVTCISVAHAQRERAWERGRWDTLAVVRVGPEGRAISPNWLVGDGDGIVLVDVSTQSVLAFGWDGRARWQYPATDAERRLKFVRHISLGVDHDVWVLDGGGHRAIKLSRDGLFRRSIATLSAGAAQKILPLGSDAVRLLAIEDSLDLTDLQPDGSVKRRGTIDIPGYRDLPPLARQAQLAPLPDGRAVFVYSLAAHWAALSPNASAPALYELIEGRATPKVRVVKTKKGVSRGLVGYQSCVACSVSTHGDTLVVLAGGTRNARGDVIDLYESVDGRYLRSRHLPVKAVHVASVGDRLALSAVDRDGTFLLLLQWRPTLSKPRRHSVAR